MKIRMSFSMSAFILWQLAIEVMCASTSNPILEPSNIPTTWIVNNSSNVCVLAQFKAEVIVDYVTRGNGTAKGTLTIPNNATVNESTSTCGDDVQILQLDFNIGGNESSTPNSNLRFTFRKGDDYFTVSDMTFELHNLMNVFSDSKHDALFGGLANLDALKTTAGYSYFCERPDEVNFRESAITFSDLQLEAFRNANDYAFSKAEVCGVPVGSRITSTVLAVTIVVGVFVLFAIALGFYFAWKNHFIWRSEFERLGP